MNNISKRITEARKQKGFSQEELAEKSKISLRTLQRIENNENNPRGATLALLCDTLQLNLNDVLQLNTPTKRNVILTKVSDSFFLICMNLVLVAIIGFLTIDSNANFNSRFGGFILSILIPFVIVYCTKSWNPTERLLKFGFGYFLYFIAVFGLTGFVTGFLSALFPCLLISLIVLFYGNRLVYKN